MQPTAVVPTPVPTPNPAKKSTLESLQAYTKHLAYLLPTAIAVVDVLLSSHVFHWNVDTIALVNGLLAALGLGSIHINSLGD